MNQLMTNGKQSPMVERMRATVRRRLREMGISAREASRRAGFNVGYVGDFLDGRSRAPESDRVAKLADALEVPLSELMGDEGSPDKTNGSLTNKQDLSAQTSMVPLLSVAVVMGDAFMPLSEIPAGSVYPVPGLEFVRGAYAFTIPNNINDPRYMAGDIVYISPAAIPRVGDFVFLKLKDGKAGVARLQEMTEKRILVKALQGARAIAVQASNLETMHKIIGALS